MTRQDFAALAVLLLCAAAVVDCRSLQHAPSTAARQLQQLTRCPAGCATDGCVLDSTSGGYKCTKCKNRLMLNPDDGTCGCPAGRYAPDSDASEDCTDCDKGSYCLGGLYTGRGVPGKAACDSGLTTIGKRSTSIKACVNVPGTYYALNSNGNPSSATCPVNTYGPGLRKQRACVPCPPGYVTQGQTGQSRVQSCVVPEGYYLKGPGQVAPCPKGEYKSGFLPAPSCTKCADGVTTENEASIAETACRIVLPTYYPASLAGVIVKTAAACPQKYYCPGGTATAAFRPDIDPLAVDGTTVEMCPFGTWTEKTGSSSADQCMTPPGYKTTNGTTVPCDDGEYRPDWRPAIAASRCLECGEHIMSYPLDQIVQYAITVDANATQVAVRASAASCYIKPGQGMYYSTASNSYRAVNCDSNNYGVQNVTYGLAAFPCRDCPGGMITNSSLPNSGAYWVVDTTSVTPLGGFTSPMACVTRAGFGYNGRVATKCPAGTYNAAGTYGTCRKCPYGLTTPNDADRQVSIDDCKLAPGFGFHDDVIQPCPVGTYNAVLRENTTAPCGACPSGLTTSEPGGSDLSHCNHCQEGWGGPGYGFTCDIQCGGVNGANFGPAGRGSGEPCFECPEQSIGFSYDYLARNQPFAPSVVARAGAASPAECLSEFAQITDTAFFMDGYAPMVNVPNATLWSECIADCKADADCQYVTYDYDALVDSEKCFKKVAGNGSAIIGFKAIVAGDMGAASINDTKTKALASGSYTFWKDTPDGIGMYMQEVTGITTVQQCLSACDQAGSCAAVVMTGLTTPTSQPTSCSQIYGNSRIAVFKRSMTKTVVTRLRLSDVL